MALQSDVLQSCIEDSAKAAAPALERCIDDAVAALQVAETQTMEVSIRDHVATAWRELLKHRATWVAQYPSDLLAAFKTELAAGATAEALAGVSPQAGTSAMPSHSPRAEIFMSAEKFSLVDDADVSRSIESSRLLQQVLPSVDQCLAELNKLISAAQGLPNVRQELNPLRPEIFTTTLRAMIFAPRAEAAIAALWIKYLAAPLGRELKLVYESAINQLEMANVQAVSYRLVQTPAAAARGSGRHTAGKGHGTGAESRAQSGSVQAGMGGPIGYVSDEPMVRKPLQYADPSRPDVKDALLQDFLSSGGGATADHGLAPEYYDNIEEELAALKRIPDSGPRPLDELSEAKKTDFQELSSVDRPQRAVDESSQLSQTVWGAFARRKARALVRTQLKKDAQRVGQVLGLELVRKLVNQVAQDPRLLTPLREGIVALEPSLLRLAMVDPHFLTDESHSGRRLMERVARRSFKYNDEFSPEFLTFFEPVTLAFNQLNSLSIEDAQPFATALTRLETIWEEEDQLEAAKRQQVLASLRFAEDRQTQADAIAQELSRRSDLDKVPGLVLDFLFGPWALAMAHARLVDTRHQVDPLGFGSVVPDLLWSVKQEVTLKQPGKLIEMIPGLLSRLHAGLALLGQDPRESESFFEGLMKLHGPVLKLRRRKSEQDAQESGLVPLAAEELPATPAQRRAKAAAQPWLGRDAMDAAGFEETLPTAIDELAPLEPAALPETSAETLTGTLAETGVGENTDTTEHPAPAQETDALLADSAAAETVAEQTLRNLRAGNWVDLYSRRHWLRAQLIWVSAKGTLFMFVSHGGQPHSMTKRSCERLIRERLLRPVDDHGVVAQALDALSSEVASQAASQAPLQAASPL